MTKLKIKITKKHHKHFNNPFPPTPKSLKFIQGNLCFNHQTVPSSPQIFSIGNHFSLTWNPDSNNGGGGGQITISHRTNPSRSIWSTVPGQSFLSAALVETEVAESRGSFVVEDKTVYLVCNHQTIETIKVFDRLDDLNSEFSSGSLNFDFSDTQFPVLLITGSVFSVDKTVRRNHDSGLNESLQFDDNGNLASAMYWVLFDEKSSNQIGFKVNFESPNFKLEHTGDRSKKKFGPVHIRKRRIGLCFSHSRSRGFVNVSSDDDDEDEIEEKNIEKSRKFNRVALTYLSEESERFFGFGEQFSYFDFKGKRVPIFVQEQGIGRGDQPITCAANLISYRAGGNWSTTYAPSPFYMSSKMKSLYLEGYNYSIFDLTRHDRVQIQIHGTSLQGRILHGNSPSELIEHFTESIGRPPELPRWIISGAVVGMQGGTDRVRQVWEKLQGHNVPISAFWLQDWVGQRETMVGSQLWWNWEVDTTRYREWPQLVQDLGDQNIKVMTYCNPCVAPTEEKLNRRRNLFDEAMKLDILVKDSSSEPYMVPNTAFDVGMLDLTHPDTACWFKQILQDMVDSGVRGWMADFGEGLPVDACLYSGEDPIAAHNRYPELWAQVNREFVEEWKSSRLGKEKDDPEEALVFFMRAGFRDSPKWGMLFWEGDQMVSWQTNDGIKSAVTGLLSSGLSGYAFNHSDIGGYCAVNVPFINYRRSEELLLRWMELNAFTTVFRTHEGNKPACNSQFYSNDRTLSHFSRFAKVYKAWKFYRVQLVKEASQKGLPVCRHLFIHYPEDKHVHKLSYQQFLVGSEILVAPVLDKGKKNVKVYFPVDKTCYWQHIWTGKIYRKPGFETSVDAPIGYPAVFVKVGSIVGETFISNLKECRVL